MSRQRDSALRDDFSSIASLLGQGQDGDIYDAVARAAVRVIPGCDHAAVSMVVGGEFRTAAASDDVAARLDELQRETGDGPCLDVATTPAWEEELDLDNAASPTEFKRRLREETPIRSVLAYRLVVEGQKSGALNLASDSPHAFGEGSGEQAAVLAAFAAAAADAAAARRRQQQLEQALGSSREIGIAVGIIAASHGLTPEDAFQVLVRASQELNRKLRDIARDIAGS